MGRELEQTKFFVRLQQLRDEFRKVPRAQFERRVEALLREKRGVLADFRLNRKRRAFSDFLRTKNIGFVENYEDLEDARKTQLIQDYLSEVAAALEAGGLTRGRARARELAARRGARARAADDPRVRTAHRGAPRAHRRLLLGGEAPPAAARGLPRVQADGGPLPQMFPESLVVAEHALGLILRRVEHYISTQEADRQVLRREKERLLQRLRQMRSNKQQALMREAARALAGDVFLAEVQLLHQENAFQVRKAARVCAMKTAFVVARAATLDLHPQTPRGSASEGEPGAASWDRELGFVSFRSGQPNARPARQGAAARPGVLPRNRVRLCLPGGGL